MATLAPPKPEQAERTKAKVFPPLSKPTRMLEVKGFIKKSATGPYFDAMCLDLNLAVRGKSLSDAEKKLRQLIGAYLQDRDSVVPRHAPASYYAQYYKLRVQSLFHVLADSKVFVENVPTSAHA